MRPNGVFRLVALKAVWREQPRDVTRVVLLNFKQAPPSMSAEREDVVLPIDADFSHAVQRFEVVDPPPQSRGIAGTVAANSPALQFRDGPTKGWRMVNGQAPKEQHRRCGIRRGGVGGVQPNPVTLTQGAEVVRPGLAAARLRVTRR